MKKKFLLLIPVIAIIIILILLLNKNEKVGKIDVSKTDFNFDVKVCNEYFKLVECIIDRDTDERFTKQMRIDLKNEIKNIQEKWKELNEEDLNKKCLVELNNYKDLLKEKKVETFGCIDEK